MKFLNLFNKKANYNLEDLLKKAADDASYRTEFLKRLLEDNLVVISDGKSMATDAVRAEVGMSIKVLTLADGRVPVFTSTDRIFDKGVIKKEVNCITAKSRDIFEFLKGAKLVLNPYSDYGKEFLPDEIERLLDGSYFSNDAREIVFKKETPIKIGQPARYPDVMIKELQKLFANDPSINAAYLAWMHDETSGDPPHYVIGINMNGDWKKSIAPAGDIFVKNYPGEIIDFCRLPGKGGVFDDYFANHAKPFYVNASAN